MDVEFLVQTAWLWSPGDLGKMSRHVVPTAAVHVVNLGVCLPLVRASLRKSNYFFCRLFVCLWFCSLYMLSHVFLMNLSITKDAKAETLSNHIHTIPQMENSTHKALLHAQDYSKHSLRQCAGDAGETSDSCLYLDLVLKVSLLFMRLFQDVKRKKKSPNLSHFCPRSGKGYSLFLPLWVRWASQDSAWQ